jgi:hypothetical protein
MDLIECIKSDTYTHDLVRKLLAFRKVGQQARVIRKVKRDEE